MRFFLFFSISPNKACASTFLVIGAKSGKISRVREGGEVVNWELGDSEERMKSSRIVSVLTLVKPRRITGVGHAQEGSRAKTKHADSTFCIGPKDRVALGNNGFGDSRLKY